MFRPTGIKLDPHNGEPLYRQIVDQVIDRVRSGAFPPGFRLPPTRTLARELDAHRNTVVRAYEELQSSGFIVSVVGRGTFVCDEPPTAESPAPPPARAGMPWGSLLSRATRAEPLGRADALARPAPRRDTINLSRMQPSDDLLPHQAMRRCIDHVLRARGATALDLRAARGTAQAARADRRGPRASGRAGARRRRADHDREPAGARPGRARADRSGRHLPGRGRRPTPARSTCSRPPARA